MGRYHDGMVSSHKHVEHMETHGNIKGKDHYTKQLHDQIKRFQLSRQLLLKSFARIKFDRMYSCRYRRSLENNALWLDSSYQPMCFHLSNPFKNISSLTPVKIRRPQILKAKWETVDIPISANYEQHISMYTLTIIYLSAFQFFDELA